VYHTSPNERGQTSSDLLCVWWQWIPGQTFVRDQTREKCDGAKIKKYPPRPAPSRDVFLFYPFISFAKLLLLNPCRERLPYRPTGFTHRLSASPHVKSYLIFSPCFTRDSYVCIHIYIFGTTHTDGFCEVYFRFFSDFPPFNTFTHARTQTYTPVRMASI